MTPPHSTSTLAAAPIVSVEETTLAFGAPARELHCVYVQVDSRSRPDVAGFLSGWGRCCDTVGVDWRSVRRPQSALVGLELRHCCSGEPASLRLVFDIRRDAAVLDALIETEAIVVGSRPYGRFANSMAAYSVDGRVVSAAVTAAGRSLERLSVDDAVAS